MNIYLIASLLLNAALILMLKYEMNHVKRLQKCFQAVDPIEFSGDPMTVPDIFEENRLWVDEDEGGAE